ncbi:hypothetical protein AMJ47_00295 [Parcubacteria bacterium DG_72]|nr:MAG: hypothetical protein AMJ47_00295 [Parcubacteria bacterium DG_72]
MLKIAFIGNVCNCAYWYTKHLRERGLDVDLYIRIRKRDKEGRPVIFFPEDPRQEDSSIGEKLPSWVKFFNIHSLKDILNINKRFGSYDLNIALQFLPSLLQFCKKPLISFAAGSDIREFVFEKKPLSFLLKRAYKRSKMIFFDNIDTGTLKGLKKIKAEKYEWIPNYISPDNLFKRAQESRRDIVKDFKEQLICFSPSRINFHQKGTNILIKGLADFNKIHKDAVKVIMIDWGKDSKKAKKLVKDFGIDHIVVFIKPLFYPDLLKTINDSSLVFGYFKDKEFGIGHFPLIIQKTLGLGNILISSIDQKAFQEVTKEKPPVLQVFSREDIKNQLENVLNNYSHIKNDFKLKGPAWIKKYHSKDFIADKLIRNINQCLN